MEKLERLISSYAKKGGLVFPDVSYSKGLLSYQEYKCTKVGVEIMLMYSSDPVITQIVPILTSYSEENEPTGSMAWGLQHQPRPRPLRRRGVVRKV